jgi:shikimate dehydrogenase
MHIAALKHFGLRGTYSLIDVAPDDLARRVPELIHEGYAGFNVTIPHKDAMYKLAAERTKEAQAAHAANTIKADGDKLVAHNTDIEGFTRALEQSFNLSDCAEQTACVLGAGGAAKAAFIALDQMGFNRILIIVRDDAKARATVSSVRLQHPERLEIIPLPDSCVPTKLSLIVNTTPIGQKDDSIPAWLAHVVRSEETAMLFDMVYARTNAKTPLVHYAESRGWNAVDGTDMLVHQASAAFEFWTGECPPATLMKEALLKARG